MPSCIQVPFLSISPACLHWKSQGNKVSDLFVFFIVWAFTWKIMYCLINMFIHRVECMLLVCKPLVFDSNEPGIIQWQYFPSNFLLNLCHWFGTLQQYAVPAPLLQAICYLYDHRESCVPILSTKSNNTLCGCWPESLSAAFSGQKRNYTHAAHACCQNGPKSACKT